MVAGRRCTLVSPHTSFTTDVCFSKGGFSPGFLASFVALAWTHDFTSWLWTSNFPWASGRTAVLHSWDAQTQKTYSCRSASEQSNRTRHAWKLRWHWHCVYPKISVDYGHNDRRDADKPSQDTPIRHSLSWTPEDSRQLMAQIERQNVTNKAWQNVWRQWDEMRRKFDRMWRNVTKMWLRNHDKPMFCHGFVASVANLWKCRQVSQVRQEMSPDNCEGSRRLQNLLQWRTQSLRVKQGCYRSSSCGVGRALNTDVHPTVSPGLHAASRSDNQPTLTQLWASNSSPSAN